VENFYKVRTIKKGSAKTMPQPNMSNIIPARKLDAFGVIIETERERN
jgi:hypothetical protein